MSLISDYLYLFTHSNANRETQLSGFTDNPQTAPTLTDISPVCAQRLVNATEMIPTNTEIVLFFNLRDRRDRRLL